MEYIILALAVTGVGCIVIVCLGIASTHRRDNE